MGVKLADMADVLSSLGHEVTFVTGQGHQPDRLLVELEGGGQRGLHAQLMFLPDMDDPQVLQMYVGLPAPVEPSGYDRLCRFLAAVNGPLPIGAFGLLEAERIVYYRLNRAHRRRRPGAGGPLMGALADRPHREQSWSPSTGGRSRPGAGGGPVASPRHARPTGRRAMTVPNASTAAGSATTVRQ